MMVRSLVLSLIVVGAAVAACGSPDSFGSSGSLVSDRATIGPLMRPGENCLSCHRAGGQAANRPWTAAGTVFERADSPADQGVSGVTVIVTDSAGTAVRMTTNEAGNFYTAAPLKKPLTLAVERDGKRKEMPIPLDADGACNACHSSPDAIGGAQGRIRAP